MVDISGYAFASAPKPGPATLGLRPEHLAIRTKGESAAITASVSIYRPMGSDTVVWLTWNDTTLSLRVMGDLDLRAIRSTRARSLQASLFGEDANRLSPLRGR